MNNLTHFFFKRGWIILAMTFLLAVSTVYFSIGEGDVILRWADTFIMDTWQKVWFFVNGSLLLLIAGFRLSERD